MTSVKLVSGVIVLLFYVKHTAALQYVPPDREVEVIQSGSYRIGVEDAIELDITRCNFTSDTGLKCSFEIWPTRANDNPNPNYCDYNGDATFLYENIVTEHGREGLCQITVDKVQHTGPNKWTLIAEDFDGQVVETNTFNVHFFYSASLLKYEIRVVEFSNFVNHMTGFAFDDLTSCYVRYNDTTIDLDLHSARTNTYLAPYSEETEEVNGRISSLGVGLCGFKYSNATNTIRHLEWTLTATDKDEKNYRQTFTTRIDPTPIPENTHSKRTVFWGHEVVIPCGSAPAANYLCSMFNPRGELMETNDCRYTVASFSMNDAGLWKCYAGGKTAMESVEYTIEFVGKNPETIDSWNYETDTYLTMGCKTVNVGSTVQYCKMIAPNQRLFILEPYIATDRYLSLGTDVLHGVCSLQIKKPLQEFEKGRWLCEIGISYQDPTGSAIIVGEVPDAEYPKYSQVTTQLNSTLKIFCEVPYFTEYCRIQAPNGTRYESKSPNQIRLGQCTIKINSVTPSDNGTWVCLFGRTTGEPDDEIITEVTVAEILQYSKFVEADTDDSVELMCSSGGLPLRYCRFVSPSGKGYQIHEYKNSSTISYYGRGLSFGDCGIKILKIKAMDNGYWTCVTEIISSIQYGEVSARMLLEVTNVGPNYAAIGIGGAVGIILIGSIFGMVVIRKWRRRSHEEFPGAATAERGINTDNTSRGSESNIFSMQPLPRLYNEEAETPYVAHQL